MTVELNAEAIGQLLKSDDVKQMLESVTSDIRGKAGDGYNTDTKLMPTRYIASVSVSSIDNDEDMTLLRCL